MKVRASITLSEGLLKAVGKCARQKKETRFDFTETAGCASIQQPIRDEQNARDLGITNRYADFLNQEACDVLEYLSR